MELNVWLKLKKYLQKPPTFKPNGKAEKSDTNFELICSVINKYLVMQKIENKSSNALLIFIIPLNPIK